MAVALVLILYGIIAAAGASLGFRRVSTILLIAGVIGGVVLTLSGALILAGVTAGGFIGLGANLGLILIFGARYMNTRAMPAKVLLGVSVVVAGILFTELFP